MAARVTCPIEGRFTSIQWLCLLTAIAIAIYTHCISKTEMISQGNSLYPITSLEWWRHQMKTFSALLALCVGDSPVTMRSLMFSLICTWLNRWLNNGEAGDLRRYRGHYDVAVMVVPKQAPSSQHGWWLGASLRPTHPQPSWWHKRVSGVPADTHPEISLSINQCSILQILRIAFP